MSTRYIQFCFIFFATALSAQTNSDAEMMAKRELCLAIMGAQDKWSSYYEGTLERTNQNIGTLTRTTLMPALAYGITNKLTFLAALPYMKTEASLGTLRSAKGFQDLSLALKYKALTVGKDNYRLTAFVLAGFAAPASNYNADYGPFSLGSGSTEWNGRALLEGKVMPLGIFLRIWSGYHFKSVSKLERNYYYDDHGNYTNEVDVPDQLQSGAALGVRLLQDKLRIEAVVQQLKSYGGSDIRVYEMPFPGTGPQMTTGGLLIQYYPHFMPELGITLSGSKVLAGRNVGLSTQAGVALMYRFGI